MSPEEKAGSTYGEASCGFVLPETASGDFRCVVLSYIYTLLLPYSSLRKLMAQVSLGPVQLFLGGGLEAQSPTGPSLGCVKKADGQVVRRG